MEGDVDSGCDTDEAAQVQLRSHERKQTLLLSRQEAGRVAAGCGNKDTEKSKEISLQPGTDKGGLRRNSSGYYSNSSEQRSNPTTPGTSNSAFSVYKLPEFKHVKSKIDTGLGKKSLNGVPHSQLNKLSPQLQKRSEPTPRYKKNSTGSSFKVPPLPAQQGQAGQGSLTRNSVHRRSLNRLFSRNTSDNSGDKHGTKANGIKTPFGEASTYNNCPASDEKRSQFSSKRSITSLSLFNSSKKDEEPQQNNQTKDRKNSFGRLRAARSSLDLSSLGFGSVSRASSRSALTELKEENDSISSTNKKKNSDVRSSKSDRPWFDLTKVWRDQTKDLPGEEMFSKMKRERSGRARTVPSGLGCLESPGLGPCESEPRPAGSGVTGSGAQALASGPAPALLPPPAPSCHNTVSVSTSSAQAHSLTPSTLKKTVNLLSPDVLTNWYSNRKKESVYGPRRNSISNLFFQPEKKFQTGHYEQRSGDKLRKSMWNLEALLSMEGEPSNHGSGKGIKRSESAGAKFAKERTRWRGIQRSESARMINMRQPSLQPRQNSHPNLNRQTSYSSSGSLTSSLDSPNKVSTCSTTCTYLENPGSDSDLEIERDPPDWRPTVPEDDLKKLSSKEIKRQDVINELFHTEKSHVSMLKVLDSVFRRPLIETGRMPREFVDRLFPNLDEVLGLHAKFNSAMKLRVKQGFPIGDICDILIEMFSNSDRLVQVCGEFTKNQNSTIEELKGRRSRDTKLETFLSDIERKPVCRRLQLQSLLPCEHQRLVKYPLLLEQLAKHTEQGQELDNILSVREKTKNIIDSIDKLVAQQQNSLRLAEIQANLDTSGLDKMGSDHPICREYRHLDLTQHNLVHDGPLVMKLGDTKRVKSLHVVLLSDCMMLLQKQGDKFLLKFHSNAASQAAAGKEESRRLFHSPIIKYSTILVRHVATDKRAFYLLNTTSQGPQIYELVAGSGSERTKWMKHITELATASQKPLDQLGLEKNKSAVRSESFRETPSSPRLDRTDRQNSSPPEGFNIPQNSPGESSPDTRPGPITPSVPKKRLQRVEILKIVDSPPMVDPSQVVVNQARIMVAAPVTTPLEKLKQKDEEVSRILDEKQKLITEILDINEDEFDTVADVAGTRGGERDARDILLAALAQARSLTSFVNSNLRVTEEDLVTRRDTFDSSGAQLVQITTSMNHHLTDLLSLMADRDTERDSLRRELAKCQDQIRGFFRPDSASGAAPVSAGSSSRPTSFISVESDGGAESSGSGDGARPHSLLSYSSDNFPLEADTDPDTRSQTSPLCEAVNGLAFHGATDIDLTPTEEAAPSPGPASAAVCDSRVTSDSDSEEILVTASAQDTGDKEKRGAFQVDPGSFCPRDSVRPPPSSSSAISASKIVTPATKHLDELRARRSKYSTYDRRRSGAPGLPGPDYKPRTPISGKTH